MHTLASKLLTIIDGYLPQLTKLPETELVFKSSPGKWSKKELIGHLIDSAQNNIRRFIVAQYEDDPTILYNQDAWVAINDYQHQQFSDLLQLWYLLNKQIAAILAYTSDLPGRGTRKSNASTIDWLAADYIKHLAHHLHQLLNLEPVAYP